MQINKAIVLSLSLSALAACGGARNYQITGTQRDPGADVQIQVENIDGGNHLVTLAIRNLTPPERLAPGMTAFVVWFRPSSGNVILASPLAYQPNSREGRATATTPQRNFTIVVTAERSAQATAPSEHVVVQHQVQL